MWKNLEKFTEGNARKFTVNFAFFGYVDVIKCHENLTIFYERARKLLQLTSPARVWS